MFSSNPQSQERLYFALINLLHCFIYGRYGAHILLWETSLQIYLCARKSDQFNPNGSQAEHYSSILPFCANSPQYCKPRPHLSQTITSIQQHRNIRFDQAESIGSFKQNLQILQMGNQGNQQPTKALEEYNEKAAQSGQNVLKSPEQAFAIKCSQTIPQMFPLLMKKINFIKNKQSFSGVIGIVQFCPVYYLKHLDCYYQGQWLDGLPHGCGISVYRNQSYYQGDFDKGELVTEQGLYYFNNAQDKNFEKKSVRSTNQMEEGKQVHNNKSSYYIGQFDKSKFQGQGRIYHKGVVYNGEWVEGRRQGEGKEYTLQFDYTFQGKYVNGLKNQKGTYTRKVGERIYVYEGEFKNGKFNGLGKIQIDNYLHYSGNFTNGKANGKGELILQQGVLRGQFKNNKVRGYGQFKYIKSQKGVITGEFQDKIDSKRTKRHLFCNKTFVTQGVFLEFPLIVGQN